MGDQDHDSFFSSIMLKNTDNQIPIEFNQATPSKATTLTTKSPSSIIEKESYKDKKCDQLATNHLMQELLHEIKHYISCLQQDNKTDYMNEYIKAMQTKLSYSKWDYVSQRGSKGKKYNNKDNNNNNNNSNDNNNNKNIINRNNINNNNNYDNNILHKISNSPPNISKDNSSSNTLNAMDNDNNHNNNNNNNNSNNIKKNDNKNNNNNDNSILDKTSNTSPNIANNDNSSNVLNDVDKKK